MIRHCRNALFTWVLVTSIGLAIIWFFIFSSAVAAYASMLFIPGYWIAALTLGDGTAPGFWILFLFIQLGYAAALNFFFTSRFKN